MRASRIARLERLHREARIMIALGWGFERTTPRWLWQRLERIQRLIDRIDREVYSAENEQAKIKTKTQAGPADDY